MIEFFSKLYTFLKNDWRNNRFLFVIEMIGTVSSITSTVAMAIFLENANLLLVYVLWLIGSSTLTVTSYIRGATWMVCLMAIYSITNIFGLIHYIGSH